jgi:transcriptional regulator with PAS, ATPase and Fis domain
MVDEGGFREDLFYRINGIQLEIPPLRKRKEDIPELSRFFLEKYGAHYNKAGIRLHGTALDQLYIHDWPGNIRELEHTIEKGVILSESGTIQPGHLFPAASAHAPPRAADSLNLEENERLVIRNALKEARGNVSTAAKLLGINRSTLYQKMKKYGI